MVDAARATGAVVRLSRVGVIHLAARPCSPLLLIGQAARVQLVQGKDWAEKARRQQFRDRSGRLRRAETSSTRRATSSVESREMFAISIAPNEVKNATAPRAGSRAMRRSGRRLDAAHRSTSSKKWVTLPGLLRCRRRRAAAVAAGVHPEPIITREYATAPGIQPHRRNIWTRKAARLAE